MGGGGGIKKKLDVIGLRGMGISECSGRPIFIFFVKENWICAMTRHYTEPNINILLIRNLHFESDIKQSSHPLMIPLHCLRAKWNNTTCGQFDSVCSHARYGCCSIVCLRFQVVQI